MGNINSPLNQKSQAIPIPVFSGEGKVKRLTIGVTGTPGSPSVNLHESDKISRVYRVSCSVPFHWAIVKGNTFTIKNDEAHGHSDGNGFDIQIPEYEGSGVLDQWHFYAIINSQKTTETSGELTLLELT